MTESGVIEAGQARRIESALIYGQMTEPPGARLTGGAHRTDGRRILRDEERRRQRCSSSTTSFASTQAVGSLGAARPHAFGRRYAAQPGDPEMGKLQERITWTKQGSVTSVQAIYVPATT